MPFWNVIHHFLPPGNRGGSKLKIFELPTTWMGGFNRKMSHLNPFRKLSDSQNAGVLQSLLSFWGSWYLGGWSSQDLDTWFFHHVFVPSKSGCGSPFEMALKNMACEFTNHVSKSWEPMILVVGWELEVSHNFQQKEPPLGTFLTALPSKNIMTSQPTPPQNNSPPEIAGLMIRAYENLLAFLTVIFWPDY